MKKLYFILHFCIFVTTISAVLKPLIDSFSFEEMPKPNRCHRTPSFHLHPIKSKSLHPFPSLHLLSYYRHQFVFSFFLFASLIVFLFLWVYIINLSSYHLQLASTNFFCFLICFKIIECLLIFFY